MSNYFSRIYEKIYCHNIRSKNKLWPAEQHHLYYDYIVWDILLQLQVNRHFARTDYCHRTHEKNLRNEIHLSFK